MREVTPRSLPAVLLVALVVGYAAVLLLYPFIVIIQSTFADGIQPVLDTFADPGVQHALTVTFILSAIALTVNVVCGVVVAWVLTRHRFTGRRLLDALVDIPFVFATPIAGYAVIVMFGREGWFSPTFIPIVFAYPAIVMVKIFVSLPFITREIQPVLGALSPDTEEAAYTIGASRWITFWRIVIPEIRTALLYGVVLTFARMVGEFGAVSVVGGALEGYTETATTFIFRALKDRNEAGGYSVSLLLCLLAVIILVVMETLRRRAAHERA